MPLVACLLPPGGGFILSRLLVSTLLVKPGYLLLRRRQFREAQKLMKYVETHSISGTLSESNDNVRSDEFNQEFFLTLASMFLLLYSIKDVVHFSWLGKTPHIHVGTSCNVVGEERESGALACLSLAMSCKTSATAADSTKHVNKFFRVTSAEAPLRSIS
jgi:hypothetical protein